MLIKNKFLLFLFFISASISLCVPSPRDIPHFEVMYSSSIRGGAQMIWKADSLYLAAQAKFGESDALAAANRVFERERLRLEMQALASWALEDRWE